MLLDENIPANALLELFLHARSKAKSAMNRIILLLPLLFAQTIVAQPLQWITDCSNKTFCLNPGSCAQGEVFLVEKAQTTCGSFSINYSYKIDLNNDNIVDIQSSEDTVSGPFPKGTHSIVWRATDNCGNLIQCTYLFHVVDCQPPSLLCINGLTQSLDAPICEASFMASQFILMLNDNCTPTNQIELGIRKTGDGSGFPSTTSVTFNECEKGFNSVEVWARDGNGLVNLCNNYVLVQDGNNDCNCNNDADVYLHGCARTGAGDKINSFRLKTDLETLPGTPNPLTKNYNQNILDSCYIGHLDKVPFGNSYKATVRAENNLGPLVGVTTYDLVLVSKHILSIEPFTNVYQMVAADVNKSNSVTTFDIVETRKLILGIYDNLPHVPSWRFTRPVANPANVADFSALVDTYQITLHNLVDDVARHNFDFIGIKYGDVSGAASLTGDPDPDDRHTAPPLMLRSKEHWLAEGEEATVELFWNETAHLEGWQLDFVADPDKLQILGLEGLPSDHWVLNGTELRAIWADGAGQVFDPKTVVISLKIKALQSTNLSDALRFGADNLRPEVYSASAAGRTTRRPAVLHFGEMADAFTTFFPPSPNPFATHVSFEMLLQKPASTWLEVFDLNGQQVYANAFDLDSGLQTLRLSASAFGGKGVFAYRLRVGDAVTSGRLVRI